MEDAKIPTLGMDAISEDTFLAFGRLIGIDTKEKVTRDAKALGARTLIEFGHPIPRLPRDCIAALVVSGSSDPVSLDRIRSAADVVDSFSLDMPFHGSRATVILLTSGQAVRYTWPATQDSSEFVRVKDVKFYPGDQFRRLTEELRHERLDGCLAELVEISDDVDPDLLITRVERALSSRERTAAAMQARHLARVVRAADVPMGDESKQLPRRAGL